MASVSRSTKLDLQEEGWVVKSDKTKETYLCMPTSHALSGRSAKVRERIRLAWYLKGRCESRKLNSEARI